MIGTLLVQEYLNTRKILFTTVGVVTLVAAVSLTTTALRVPVLGTVGLVLGVGAVALILPSALVVLAASYWRTMYGREGYFAMTIPVRGRTLFTAKVIYGLAVTLAAAVIALAGAAAARAAFARSQGLPAARPFTDLWDAIGSIGFGAAWLLAGLTIVQLVLIVVAGAAIMSIGAEGRFNHLGFGAPVIGYVIFYFAMQVLGLAAMLFIPWGVTLTGPDAGAIVAQGMFADFVDALQAPSNQAPASILGLGYFPLGVVVIVLLGWWGARSVERHTSLR